MSNDNFKFPARFLRLLARNCRLQEKDLPALLRGTSLPVEILLPGEDAEICYDEVTTLFENLKHQSDVTALGLKLGASLSPQIIGPIGDLLMNAPDIVSCLKAPIEYQALRVLFVETKLSFDENNLRCEMLLYVNFEDLELYRLMLEAFAVNMQRNMETVLGRKLTEAKYQFAYSSPEYAEAYSDFINGEVSFGHERNEILIPLETAKSRRNGQSTLAYTRAAEYCRRLMDELPSKNLTTPERVTRILLSQPLGTIGEQDVAQALYVSKRTLARRLDDYQTSYRQIRDRLLASLAVQYLRDDKLSVDAIAILLGYQDTSNFRRAFRRWYQTSPSQLRTHMAALGETPSPLI